MSGWFDAIVAFIQAHAAWAPAIIFVFIFLKSLAFVSLIVPTWFVVALGGLVGVSGLDFWPIWTAMTVGAGLGDWVSYWIGSRLKGRAWSVWPMSRYPALLMRGERFFRRWGAISVVLCRLFSPARATVPLLCGIFEMPWRKFQIANWVSAPLWSFIVLAPGTFLAAWFR